MVSGNRGGRKSVLNTSDLVSGDVAQLGERGVRNAEVEGSNPFISTKRMILLHI